MNLEKTAKALTKINRLYEIINDIGEASTTEKDLLRAYAKELYESLSEDTLDDEISKDLKKQKKEEKRLRKEKEKQLQLEQEAKAAELAKAEKEAALKAAKEVEEQEINEEAAQEEPKVEEELKAQPATMASSASDSKVAAPTALGGFSSSMIELFEVNSVSELSDKLSQSPIADLTKAMGINEKIFTVNELFGGNSDEFNKLMVALNGLSNYDEARVVLMKSAASKYDWDTPGMQDKARNFVKLIQRRYK